VTNEAGTEHGSSGAERRGPRAPRRGASRKRTAIAVAGMTAVAALGVSTVAVAAPLGSAPALGADTLPPWTEAGLSLAAPSEDGPTPGDGGSVSFDALPPAYRPPLPAGDLPGLPADDLAELPPLAQYANGAGSPTTAPSTAPPPPGPDAPAPAAPVPPPPGDVAPAPAAPVAAESPPPGPVGDASHAETGVPLGSAPPSPVPLRTRAPMTAPPTKDRPVPERAGDDDAPETTQAARPENVRPKTKTAQPSKDIPEGGTPPMTGTRDDTAKRPAPAPHRPQLESTCSPSDDLRTEVRTGPRGNVTGARVTGLPASCTGRKIRLVVQKKSGGNVEVAATAKDGRADFTLPRPIPPRQVADVRLALR
jgi:hypothetical protein